MTTVRSSLAFCILVLTPAHGESRAVQERPADAQQDAKKVLLRAVREQGGKGHLSKYLSWHAKFKAFHVSNGKRDPLQIEFWFQSPMKIKHVYEFDHGTLVKVFDGKQGWDKTGQEKAAPIEPNALEDLRQACIINRILKIFPLLDSQHTQLSRAKKVKVKQTEAWAIAYQFEGIKGTLFFDQKDGLLIKREEEGSVRHDGKQAKVEEFFEKYKKVDGIILPIERRIYVDDKLLFEITLVEISPLKDSNDIFLMPK